MDTKKLNIAVIISSDLHSGGGYQYEYKILDLLKKHHKDKNIAFNFYGFKDDLIKDYADLELEIKIFKENVFQRLHRISLLHIVLYKIFSKLNMNTSYIEKKLLKDNIDLVYFLSPSLVSQGLNNIPYVFTLWDLGHIDTLEFPETSHNRVFESREFVYTKSLKKAYKIIVDLEHGKQNAIKNYNLDEKRIKVLKFLPNIKLREANTSIDIKDKYNLSNNFIFYPAQFWAHKNHIYILKAIKILREEKGIDLDVIFSGSNKGNLDYILKKAKEFKVDDLMHYIGFVSSEEIPLLYKQSIALVMPTYLGPTNIPPLEAFCYETSVCYSDLPSFREQVGDAAFFMDLKNPYSLVDHLITIQNNPKLVDDKKKLGLKIISEWNDKNFYEELISIFQDYSYIRELWD